MEKQVYLPAEQLEYVRTSIRKFWTTHRCSPSAILCGANEYLSLQQELKQLYESGHVFDRGYSIDPLRELFALPVFVKQSRGIELAIPQELAARFSIGIMKDGNNNRDHHHDTPERSD